VRATDIAVKVARVAAVAFLLYGLGVGSLQLVVLSPMLWFMGTRELMIARMTAPRYTYDKQGYTESSVEVLGRDPFGYGRGWSGRPHRPFWDA
jgi:hypothetical protein